MSSSGWVQNTPEHEWGADITSLGRSKRNSLYIPAKSSIAYSTLGGGRKCGGVGW